MKLVSFKLYNEELSFMDIFLGVVAPTIDEALQKLVHWLVNHLSTQPMAFPPSTEMSPLQLVVLGLINFVILGIFISHLRSYTWRVPLLLWRRSLLFTLHSLMWFVNPHDVNYQIAVVNASLTATAVGVGKYLDLRNLVYLFKRASSA